MSRCASRGHRSVPEGLGGVPKEPGTGKIAIKRAKKYWMEPSGSKINSLGASRGSQGGQGGLQRAQRGLRGEPKWTPRWPKRAPERCIKVEVNSTQLWVRFGVPKGSQNGAKMGPENEPNLSFFFAPIWSTIRTTPRTQNGSKLRWQKVAKKEETAKCMEMKIVEKPKEKQHFWRNAKSQLP